MRLVRNSIHPITDFDKQFPDHTPEGLYKSERDQIKNYRGLGLVMMTRKGAEFRKGNHNLVIDGNGNCYWWPKWLRLANKSGIINSIASNYCRGYNSANQLYQTLAKSTISFLENLKNRGNDEIKLSTVFNHLRDILEKHYEKLSPSRFQVISSPDWSFRIIICDEPRIDLQEIVIPEQSLKRWTHPFPTEWLIESFAEMEISPDIVGPRDKIPGLLDVFQSGDYKRTLNSISGEIRTVTPMLKQIGFPANIVDLMPTSRRPHILLRSLGFEPKREKYYEFFNRESLEKKLGPGDMFKILEMRCIEVYSAWIKSFKSALEIESEKDYFATLNEGITKSFDIRKISLGVVLMFIRTHRGQLNRNTRYADVLTKKIPERFLQTSKKCEEMLEILTAQRNQFWAHSPSSQEKEEITKTTKLAKKLNWEDPNIEWEKHEVMTNITSFFREFYGVSDTNSIPRVPTLMKVTAIEESTLGHKAIMTCQRNGVENKISLNKKYEIQYYDLDGKLVENKRPDALTIGMRMYILPTTNPVIVAPIVSHA